MRIRFTLDIERGSQVVTPEQDEFEHRDTDTLVEATGGGDTRQHRMGFLPSPIDPEEHTRMQAARVQFHPAPRAAGSRIVPPKQRKAGL